MSSKTSLNDNNADVADALLRIAEAINRLAGIHERAQERVANSAERFETFMTSGCSGRAQ